MQPMRPRSPFPGVCKWTLTSELSPLKKGECLLALTDNVCGRVAPAWPIWRSAPPHDKPRVRHHELHAHAIEKLQAAPPGRRVEGRENAGPEGFIGNGVKEELNNAGQEVLLRSRGHCATVHGICDDGNIIRAADLQKNMAAAAVPAGKEM